MNIHSQSRMQPAPSTDRPFEFRSGLSCDGIEVSQADTMDDFIQVTRLLVSAARRRYGGISGLSIGSTLARLNHGGSGPDTGCVLIARAANRVTGCAVLQAMPDNEVEMAWLDADNDGVAGCLWDRALAVVSEWGSSGIRVGQFAESPRRLVGRAQTG